MINRIKNVGIVLLALLSLTQLYDWFRKWTETDLVGTVLYGTLMLPDTLNGEIRSTYDLCSVDSLESFLATTRAEFHDRNSAEIFDRVVRDVSYELRQRIPSRLPYEFSSLSGYWAVAVQNDGTKLLRDVLLTLPNTVRLVVRREGEEPHELSSGEVIRLGNLQPRESITVFAWTKITPSSLYFDQVRLTHSAGVGTLHFLAPVGSLGQWVDANAQLAITLLLLILFATLALYAISYFEEKSKKPAAEAREEGKEDAAQEGERK